MPKVRFLSQTLNICVSMISRFWTPEPPASQTRWPVSIWWRMCTWLRHKYHCLNIYLFYQQISSGAPPLSSPCWETISNCSTFFCSRWGRYNLQSLKQPFLSSPFSNKLFLQTALSQISFFFFNQPSLNVNDGIADGTTALMVAAMLGNNWAISRWGKMYHTYRLGWWKEETPAVRICWGKLRDSFNSTGWHWPPPCLQKARLHMLEHIFN